MFFSKSFISAAVVLLSATLQVSAHAAVSPVLGVAGTPVRSDVQRPNNARPCGRTNIAATMDTSDTITMNADNTFTATITNFNKRLDGSREIASALVDTTGTGEQFNQKATVLENGTRAPKELGSEQLKIQMPQAACTGGATGDKCLVSFKTASGFGNCVVIQNAAGSNSTDTSTSDSSSVDTNTSTSVDTDTSIDASTSTSVDASTSTSIDTSASTSIDTSASTSIDASASTSTSISAARGGRAAAAHRIIRRRAGPSRLSDA